MESPFNYTIADMEQFVNDIFPIFVNIPIFVKYDEKL